MKRRRREMEKQEKKTEIRVAIEELSLLVKLNNNKKSPSSTTTPSTTNDDDIHEGNIVITYIPTKPFLSMCYMILQILDKIGPTMAVLRQDIFKNIQKLEIFFETDPTSYSNLVAIIKKEAVERNAKRGDSCSKALLWLTRSLDFTTTLLEKVANDPRENMEQLVRDSYEITLKPWHGWISATAYKVALKLVPDTDTFISLLMAKGDHQNFDTFKEEIQVFISLLVPLLDDIHTLLSSNGLDRLKST